MKFSKSIMIETNKDFLRVPLRVKSPVVLDRDSSKFWQYKKSAL